MILLYDGTLAGFFSAVFEAYRCGIPGMDYEFHRAETYDPGLFDESRTVQNQPEEAARVMAGIRRNIGRRGLNTITRAFLSELPECENIIFRFIQKGMKKGECSVDDLGDPDALGIMEMSRKTMKEYHRFLGLIRFRGLSTGEYYAPFRPDTNVLPLLGRHFASRFPDQAWMIHDKGRETALIHMGGRLELISMKPETTDPAGELTPDLAGALKAAENEDPWAELWKIYHKKIGIEERANPKLQQQFIPKKHWEFLPEMN